MEITETKLPCKRYKYKSQNSAINAAVSWGKKGASAHHCDECKAWHIRFIKKEEVKHGAV